MTTFEDLAKFGVVDGIVQNESDLAEIIIHMDMEPSDFSDQDLEHLELVLEQSGVKGMKWGVRNDKGFEGQRAKTSKIAKLDKQFDKSLTSYKTVLKIHNDAAERTNKNDVDRINNKPEYKDADFTRDSPLRQKYYKEHQSAFIDNLERAAADLGTNASGTKQYGILETDEYGSWDVFVKDVKHAIGDEEPSDEGLTLEIEFDETGHIKKLTIPQPIIQHFGVPGMKWGRRKSKDAVTTSTDSGDKESTGDRVKKALGRASDALTGKDRETASRAKGLSNEQLQTAIKRMQLEQQYSQLAGKKKPAFIDATQKVMANAMKQQATTYMSQYLGAGIGVALTKAGVPNAQDIVKKVQEAGKEAAKKVAEEMDPPDYLKIEES